VINLAAFRSVRIRSTNLSVSVSDSAESSCRRCIGDSLAVPFNSAKFLAADWQNELKHFLIKTCRSRSSRVSKLRGIMSDSARVIRDKDPAKVPTSDIRSPIKQFWLYCKFIVWICSANDKKECCRWILRTTKIIIDLSYSVSNATPLYQKSHWLPKINTF
jgi:hypothetical protein